MAKRHQIYQINFPSGKHYIGLTNDIVKRKRGHLSEAKLHKNNRKSYNAIRKYGFNSLEWVIIEDNLTKEEACEKEIFYIQKFNSAVGGYNMSAGGGTGNGELVKKAYENKEIRAKLSRAHGVEPFLICNMNGDVIERFENTSECARKYNLCISSIRRCLLRVDGRSQTKGYVFFNESEYSKEQAIEFINKQRFNFKRGVGYR